MSTKYLTLLELLRRPQGVDSREACSALDVSPSTYRGMVRDFRELFAVRSKIDARDRRRVTHAIVDADRLCFTSSTEPTK